MYGLGGLQSGASKTKTLVIAGVGLLLVIIAIVVAVMMLQGKNEANAETDTDPKDNAATTSRIITKVGELYDLPKSEEPTVAAIQDKTKLANQEFFNKAVNGDYLLVYTEAKLALLYREDIDKLINVGHVNMDTTKTEGKETIPPRQ
jgi:hypothetical protein